MIAQRRPSQPSFTDLKMSSIDVENVGKQNKSNWIEPWSKAVSQAAEDQKKSHKRRNSFLTQNKHHHQSTIIQQSNVFENATRLPSPPILQRIFFSPHPDDIAYSAFGTASKKPRCCHHDEEDEDLRSNASTSSSSYKKQSHLRVQREDSGIALPSPSLSASSKFSDDATLVATPSYASSVSSTSSGSRRNSSIEFKSNNQNALIVTVFSKSRCANGEIGAKLNRNVEDTTSLRTDEDEQFARSIGCDLLQLGFPDSSARDEPSRRPDLAELAMNKHLPGQKIRHVDHYIFEDVRKSLEPIVWMAIRAGAKIHLPLGVGCHVDHWMVRVAVLSILDELDIKLGQTTNMLSEPLKEIFSTHLIGGQEPLHERLIFYEDLPYADAQTNSHVEQLAKAVLPLGAKAKLVHLTENDWCKKRAAILAYASQMKPTILPSLYNHATRLAQLGKTIDPEFDSSNHHQVAERIWVIDAKLRRKLALEQQ